MDNFSQYQIYRNEGRNAVFILDIQMPNRNSLNIKLGIESYIKYCQKYGLDLIIQKKVNQNFRSKIFESYVNNYYGVVTPQIHSIRIFQHYDNIMVVPQNDIIITPNAKNYILQHQSCNNDLTFNYTINGNVRQHVKRWHNYIYGNVGINLTYDSNLEIFETLFNETIQDLVFSGFNNVFSRELLIKIFDIKQFQNFIEFCIKHDPTNKLNLWDSYFLIKNHEIISQKGFKIGFYKQFSGDLQLNKLPEIALCNVVEYDQQRLTEIKNNVLVQYIHFFGGGESLNPSTTRLLRMKRFFNHYYKE